MGGSDVFIAEIDFQMPAASSVRSGVNDVGGIDFNWIRDVFHGSLDFFNSFGFGGVTLRIGGFDLISAKFSKTIPSTVPKTTV
jgi:hypothetical protein